MPKTKIEISTANLLKAILVLLGLFILYQVREVVLVFFVALVFVAALNPLVGSLERKKIPRILSTLLIFLTAFGIFGLTVYLMIPPLIEQISGLASSLPEYLNKLPFNLKTDYLQKILENFAGHLAGIPAGISSVIVILIISFYLLAQKQGIERFIETIVPRKRQTYVLNISRRIQSKLGFWLLGQITASLMVGILTFVGLAILGVPYALVLALAVGLAEIIPFGPVIAFIPAGILGFLESPLTGFLVIALYLVIQQIEGHIVVPQIMKKAVGLNPVVVILSILIGAKLAGIMGLLVAIPAAAVLSVLLSDVLSYRKKIHKKAKVG